MADVFGMGKDVANGKHPLSFLDIMLPLFYRLHKRVWIHIDLA